MAPIVASVVGADLARAQLEPCVAITDLASAHPRIQLQRDTRLSLVEPGCCGCSCGLSQGTLDVLAMLFDIIGQDLVK